jgi:hypothetical protein
MQTPGNAQLLLEKLQHRQLPAASTQDAIEPAQLPCSTCQVALSVGETHMLLHAAIVSAAAAEQWLPTLAHICHPVSGRAAQGTAGPPAKEAVHWTRLSQNLDDDLTCHAPMMMQEASWASRL